MDFPADFELDPVSCDMFVFDLSFLSCASLSLTLFLQ